MARRLHPRMAFEVLSKSLGGLVSLETSYWPISEGIREDLKGLE